MIGKILRVAIFCGSFLWSATTVHGGLIVDPLGTTLFDGSTGDELRVELTGNLAPGTGFSFFGAPVVSSVFVSENGHVGFSQLRRDLPGGQGQKDYFPGPLGSVHSGNTTSVAGTAMIAPLWDDYRLDTSLNNSVTARYVPNHYLQVTWSNVRLDFESPYGEPFPDTSRSVQMVWFDGDTTIRGFDFKKDDIAFGYIPHTNIGPEYFGPIFATAGLDKGDGSYSSVLGTPDGVLFADDGGLLAWGENDFLLFRPGTNLFVPDGFLGSNFQGGYHRGAFTLTAVPEPSTFLLLFVASGYPALRVWKNSLRRKHISNQQANPIRRRATAGFWTASKKLANLCRRLNQPVFQSSLRQSHTNLPCVQLEFEAIRRFHRR